MDIYDFDDETVVSFAPGQTVGIHRIEDGPAPEAFGLLFHPDFLLRTPLGQKIKQYTFFSYASNEALHLSKKERMILQDYMDKHARHFVKFIPYIHSLLRRLFNTLIFRRLIITIACSYAQEHRYDID